MPISEKKIFGILTADQVGYVPNIKVNFTESSETFCQDTYKFQSMRRCDLQNGQFANLVYVDLNHEYNLEKRVNEYVPQEEDIFDQPLDNICTVEQLEIFYRTLVMDLYRREYKINYNLQADNIEKRYFIVPLRLIEVGDPSHYTPDGQRQVLTYAVDHKLLQKTERLHKQGYKASQDNVPDWLRKKGLLGAMNK